MKHAILAVGCMVAMTSAQTPDTTWARLYAGIIDLHTNGKDLVVTPQDQLFVAGIIYPFATGAMTVGRYTLDGELVWSESLLAVGSTASPRSMRLVLSPTGTLVAGAAGSETPTDGLKRRYFFARDTTGALRWLHIFESYSTYYNVDVAAGSLGNSYLCGQTLTDSGGVDIHVVKVDDSGGLQWQQTIDGPGRWIDLAEAIAVDGAGRVCVVGSTTDSDQIDAPTFIRLLPDGTLDRLVRCSPAPGFAGSFRDLVVLNDGGVVAVCDNSITISPSYCVKFSADGDTVWCSRLDGSARLLALSEGGVLCVAGQTADWTDMCVWKLGPDGRVLWCSAFDGPAHLEDRATALHIDRSGSILVTGYSTTQSAPEVFQGMATVKFTSAGELLWAELFRPGGCSECVVRGVGTDSESSVYVTGLCKQPPGWLHWYTLKYPPTHTGVAGSCSGVSPLRASQTVCRGSLRLPCRQAAALLDITGRRVMELRPGENDVRGVAPGIYFVRREEDNSTTKVVVQR